MSAVTLSALAWRPMSVVLPVAFATLLALAVGACSGVVPARPDIRIDDPWVRAAPGPAPGQAGTNMMATPSAGHGGMGAMSGSASEPRMGVSAAYMTLTNRGGIADWLVSARCDVAGVVELHESVREGNVVRMRPVPRIEVPAGGQVTLAPGGLHVMLMELKQELKPGAKVPLVLRFERSGEIGVEAIVR